MVCQGQVIFFMFKDVTEIIVPAPLLGHLLSIQSATSKLPNCMVLTPQFKP